MNQPTHLNARTLMGPEPSFRISCYLSLPKSRFERTNEAAWVVVNTYAQPLNSQVEEAFRPANAALRSHSKCAVLSFCASREGAIGRHL